MKKFYIFSKEHTQMGMKRVFPNPTITFYYKPKDEDKKKKYTVEVRNFTYITDSDEMQEAIENGPLSKRIDRGEIEVKSEKDFKGSPKPKKKTHSGGHDTKSTQEVTETEESTTRKHKKLDKEAKEGA